MQHANAYHNQKGKQKMIDRLCHVPPQTAGAHSQKSHERGGTNFKVRVRFNFNINTAKVKQMKSALVILGKSTQQLKLTMEHNTESTTGTHFFALPQITAKQVK